MFSVAQMIEEETADDVIDVLNSPTPPNVSKLIDRFGNRFYFANAGDLWLPPLPIGTDNNYFTHLKGIQAMEMHDTDILICSYPKTGLHWHMEIVTMLLEQKLQYTSHEAFSKSYLEFNESLQASDGVGGGKVRILHTHLPFRYLPRQVFAKKVKVIQLVRNPKDVMTSLYCQVQSVLPPMNYTGTFDQFVLLLLECGYHYGVVFDYLMDFQTGWEQNPDVPVFTSVFEDMKMNPVECIRQLNQFLDTGCSDEFCQQIAQHCEFRRVKSYKDANADSLQKMIYRKDSEGFYRKGDVGDWKNWFSVDLNQVFDEQCRQRMPGYRITFQYE